jgi:hypothetical protein
LHSFHESDSSGVCAQDHEEDVQIAHFANLELGGDALAAAPRVELRSAAAPPTPKAIEGMISGVEICPQDWCTNGAFFTGSFTGKVDGKRTSGLFLVQVAHTSLAEGLVTGGSWIVRTKRGDVGGTITSGVLTANNDQTFDVTLTLQVAQPAGGGTLTFVGLLDHSGLDEEIPDLQRSR